MMPEPVIDRAIRAGIGGRAWRVVAVICLHADENGEAFPSLTTIANRTGIARHELPRVIRELVDAGIIEVIRRGARYKGRPCNKYRLATSRDDPATVRESTDSPQTDSPQTDSEKAGTAVRESPYQTNHKTIPSEASPPRERPRARPAAKTPIAEDWRPNERDRAYAAKKGLAPQEIWAEVEKFASHHRKLGNRFADWHAAWETWCQRVDQYRPRAGRAPSAGPPSVLKVGKAALQVLQGEAPDPPEDGAGRPVIDAEPFPPRRAAA